MREAERVAGLAGGDHGLRRAARPLSVGPVRVEPEAERHPDRVRAKRSSATALSTPPLIATATRPGDGAAVKIWPERVRERVRGQSLARDRGGLEQR